MNVHIYEAIEQLVLFGIRTKLIDPLDRDYTRNAILEVLALDEWVETEVSPINEDSPALILERILDWAAANGRLKDNKVTDRDLLDTKIMGCFLARPSEIYRHFNAIYNGKGPEAATKYLYDLSKHVHYIRTDRIAKNEQWYAKTAYGDMEITINLSKPEKDPQEILAEKQVEQGSYPKCLLCKENIGYAGRVNHPARQNHRAIPIQLSKERWYLQFSPYVYYEEHAIVFFHDHKPMHISKRTFEQILAFVSQFPHYFLGSNADLPIVGGSILSHDHFQGGKHEFPMAKAEIEWSFQFVNYPQIKAGIVNWPMSVIRLQGEKRDALAALAADILHYWKTYSDEEVDIYAATDDRPHNTITPIARRKGKLYELDLVLRNNRVTEEHPLGIFHPHKEVHHIKKENIGLIEVMGLAVLPGRLKKELQTLAIYLSQTNDMELIQNDHSVSKHLDWAKRIKQKYGDFHSVDIEETLREEVAMIFASILEHAGVFKRDETGKTAFKKFLKTMNVVV